MKRAPTRKSGDRRKRTRKIGSGTRREVAPDSCHYCEKSLSGEDERALYVEEEVGRIFCSESCIASYFTPEIERLEKEYFRRLAPSDLDADEREALSHLRWLTLEEPDEVWREKTLAGDFRYTLISEFRPGTRKVWSICICLFLRGEPSFLYLALSTRNAAMVNQYRRGERVEWSKKPAESAVEGELARQRGKEGEPARQRGKEGELARQRVNEGEPLGAHGARIDARQRVNEAPPEASEVSPPTDRLADPWTADETLRARMNQERGPEDIQSEDFGNYQSCIEPTLETPDEVWSLRARGPEGPKLYHFIRHFSEENPSVWYVIVARETEEEEQIEILDAFPTRDRHLVESYRQGEQEVGRDDTTVRSTARVVH